MRGKSKKFLVFGLDTASPLFSGEIARNENFQFMEVIHGQKEIK
nr:MAG TPA: hypothetical protein [Caudoviricetes sp.]